MKVVPLVTALLLCACTCLFGAVSESTPHLPFVFEENAGQASPDVDFIGRTQQGTVLLTRDGAILIPRGTSRRLAMHISGARRSTARPSEVLPSTTSYFLGQDSSRWRTG